MVTCVLIALVLVFLEVVAVVWLVAGVVVVVVVVVEVAAAQMAANRSAVGMFVVTGGGASVELAAMSFFLWFPCTDTRIDSVAIAI